MRKLDEWAMAYRSQLFVVGSAALALLKGHQLRMLRIRCLDNSLPDVPLALMCLECPSIVAKSR